MKRPLQRLKNSRGYTLVEILIAMTVLMISFLAIIAVETSTLQGYISARNATEAAEMGRRITDMLHVEGQAWRVQPDQPFGPTSGAYASATSPFDGTTRPLLSVSQTQWVWFSLFTQPVSLNFANSLDDPNITGSRFCAWVRGGRLGGATATTQAIQVQVAVVYAGSYGSLSSCSDVPVGSLDASGDSFPGESLETLGLRASYFGTVITPSS